MSTTDRDAQVAALLARVTAWAGAQDDVRAVALVGSEARGAAGPDSDVDLVVVADAAAPLVAADDWLAVLTPGGTEIRRREWGPLTERRMSLPSGLVVELGVVGPGWLELPLDAGTARVLADGAHVLHDPEGLLAAALDTLAGR